MKRVSLKLALQLKAAKCTIKTTSGYVFDMYIDNTWSTYQGSSAPSYYAAKNYCARPTYNEVVDYLREKRKIHCYVRMDATAVRWVSQVTLIAGLDIYSQGGFKHYHQAQLAGIKQALKLLSK